MPSLTSLLAAVNAITTISGDTSAVEISGITLDSREVKPGFIFAALKGEKTDGTQFIPQAKASGAVAILEHEATKLPTELSTVLVELKTGNPRLALAQLAAAFYPEQPKHLVAVTGTDGKTSTADFYRQFWHLMNKPSASLGTLGALGGNGELLIPGSHTTPEPVALHRILSQLAAQKVDYVAMEASSHGLDQFRLDGVRLQAAAFTNIARDHLDYHKTEEAYFIAKRRLFDALLPTGGTAVLNADDARYPELEKRCRARGHKIISFGRKGAELTVNHIEPLPHGQKLEATLLGKHYSLAIPLAGAFQVMNILAALGLVVGAGGALEEALAVIPKLKGVPGRLEQVATLANGAAVFIDYAHTPMALANILNTLRPHTKTKLHVVFGCGGDRDTGKRPEMGKIANLLADSIIVTDDNPRSEVPAAIRAAILAQCPRAIEVEDRGLAIYAALKQLQAGDILVIAGKGHEKTQTMKDKTIPFDDAEVARRGVRELGL